MKKPSLSELQKLQASSLGYLLIRCGQLWNARGVAAVNAESATPMLRDAHTRLFPYLQQPGGIRITELARRLDVTKQAVQQLVADLVDQGFARLEPDPDDARARRVTLTEHGVKASLYGTGVLLGIERELTPAFGKRDAKELRQLLSRLLMILEAEASDAT